MTRNNTALGLEVQDEQGDLYLNGKFVEDGVTRWYLHGHLHRSDGPAVECANGDEYWYQYGQLHRLNGPAVVTDASLEWFRDGLRHRIDGPAIEWLSGTKEWFYNGQIHRVWGPAIENANGSQEWYLEGRRLTEAYHHEYITQVREIRNTGSC